MKKKLHKLLAVLLILALLAGLTMPAMAADHPFNDVPGDQWYSEAVQFVYEHNIMGGVGNNQFNPQGSLTRAQVTALLFRVHHERTANAQDDRDNNFNDVGNTWYAPYVTWAFDNDIVFGTSATTFNPNGNITRQEFATMVYRYAMNMTDLQDSTAASAQWSQFTDRGQIATWAHSALRWMNYHGIVTGSTATTINPTGTATRAEAAVIMMRFVRENERLSAPFVLTISVEETSLPQGENFRVHVELRNNSGEDHEIARYSLFYPHIPGESWIFARIPPPWPTFQLFESGSTISTIIYLNSFYDLSPGVYHLNVGAMFYLGWEQPADPENEPIPWEVPDNAQRIVVRSNIVELTVQ